MIITLRMSYASAGGTVHEHNINAAALNGCLIEFSAVWLQMQVVRVALTKVVTVAVVVEIRMNVFLWRGVSRCHHFPSYIQSLTQCFSSFFLHHNSLDRGEVAIGMHRQHWQIHHHEYHWEIILFLLHAAGIWPP
ncbi:hypothetical protein XENOCAPTIV_007076 [Xenoophorus captivus]|uniref:Uncharacterized protein n=1 Tax=Xenoophorus captivus TaxID=1517983 RepID=A0ABV0RC07_9TELE